MSIRRDYRRRRSFSYKMKRWFWSDHTKEIKTIFNLAGEFIITILWFSWIFFLPHLFR
jgi:hypothetical protein